MFVVAGNVGERKGEVMEVKIKTGFKRRRNRLGRINSWRGREVGEGEEGFKTLFERFNLSSEGKHNSISTRRRDSTALERQNR